MTYYILEVTTVNETTAKALWEQSTLDAAKAQFHQIMANAHANPDCTYALAMIVDDRGFCQVMDRKPVYEEPEE